MTLFAKFLSILGLDPRRVDSSRASRVPLSPLHDIRISAHLPELAEPLTVANISTTGIGIIKAGDGHWPKVGETFKATVGIGPDEYTVALKTVHNTGKVLGAAFIAASPDLKQSIEHYFAAELTGLSFIEVNQNSLKAEEDGTPHWYRGRGNGSLYFVEDGGTVRRFTMTFFGSHIEGERGKGSRFGHIVDDDPGTEGEDGHAQHKASSLVRLSSGALPPELEHMALRMLEQVANLSPSQKTQIQAMIKGEHQ